MKRFAFLLGILALAAVSCDHEKDPVSEIKLTSDATQAVSADGGTVSFTFTAGGEWTANVPSTESYSWASINPTKGGSGENTVTVTVLPNKTNDARSMYFTLHCGSASTEAHVMQIEKDGFAVVNKEFNLGSDGGDITVQVLTNVAYSFEIDAEAASWIRVAPTSKALETKGQTFTVAANRTFGKRSGTIKVTGGEVSETVTIAQAELMPVFEVPDETLYIAKEGGSVLFTIEADPELEVSVTPSEDYAGVTVKADDGSYTVTAPANTAWADEMLTFNVTTVHPDADTYSGTVNVVVEGNYEVAWKSALTDLAGVNVLDGVVHRLGWSGGSLILFDGAALHTFNPDDGTMTGTVALPDDFDIADVATDDAGHIVLLGSVDDTYKLYYLADLSSTTPVLFGAAVDMDAIEWRALGNVRVKGDVTGSAVVTAITHCDYANEPMLDNGAFFTAWSVSGGTAAAPTVGHIPEIHPWMGVWWMNAACVAPAGDSFADGLFYIGYTAIPNDGEPTDYDLFFAADPTAADAENGWADIYHTASLGDENYQSFSAATIGGKTYGAFARGAYWDVSNAGVYVLDIDDPENPVEACDIPADKVQAGDYIGAWDGENASSDVLLVPSADGKTLYVFTVDGLFNHIACITLPVE